MGKFIDMTGKRFGRLMVISRVEGNQGGVIKWLCKCDCGSNTTVSGKSLRKGETKSCGCLKLDLRREAFTTHGKSETRLYIIFKGMKNRCYYKAHTAFQYYGGRGIGICEEWLNDFNSFYEWSMENGYSDDLTIDRIDTNGNYEPDNCRWATMLEQLNNTRYNHIMDYDGESHTLAEWARIKGLMAVTIYGRVRKGWSPKRVLSPVTRGDINPLITINNESHTPIQWAKIKNISAGTIRSRIKRGWLGEKILAPAQLGNNQSTIF